MLTGIFAFVLVVGGGAAVRADTIYVDAAASGLNDGSSWVDAYSLLQDGLDAAVSEDQIWVAAGTYYPTTEVGGSGDRYKTFQMKNGVGIYGGFPAIGNPAYTHVTILSGDIGVAADDSDNCYHVFYHPFDILLEPNAVLDGFTITGGNADNNSLTHEFSGGGMWNQGCVPTVTNCTFSGNSAASGAGMYNQYSDPIVISCTFSGNSADYGGGMTNYDSDPTVTNCTFSGNLASVYGGGMENETNGNPTMSGCTFSDNTAAYGGGVYSWISDPNITNCTFSDNSAISGGGICDNQNNSTVISCIFSGNSADYGGGMTNYEGNSTVTNCTFSGNSANAGGGMYNENLGNPTVSGCTFGSNTAVDFGSGMGSVQNSNPVVANCIFWGNLGPSGPLYEDGTGSLTVTYSDVQGGGIVGSGNIDADPMFTDPNGVDGTAGTADDDLRLLSGSPCIDAGDNTAVPVGVTTDLDGNNRFVDDEAVDTGNGTPPIVDMGAYERDIVVRTLVVDQLKLKSGKTVGGSMDSFSVKGSLADYAPGDYVNGDAVLLQLGGAGILTVNAQFKQSGTKDIYSYKSSGPGITSVKLDFEKGTFAISGKNVSLIGLSSPVQVTLTVGNYSAKGSVAGSVPLQFMCGVTDILEVTSVKYKAGKEPNIATLTLAGLIAADPSLDPDELTVTVHVDGEVFNIAVGEFVQKGSTRKYSYKGIKSTEGYLSKADLDLDKCTFKFMFKNLDVSAFAPSPESLQLSMGSFVKAADFEY